MKKMGALEPQKLARFTAANIDLIAKEACKRCSDANTESAVALLVRLQGEARLQAVDGGPWALLDWNRKVEWYSADLKRKARNEVVMEAQAAHDAESSRAPYPATSSVTSIVGKRVSAKKRKVRSEAEREGWALRALKVLLSSRLLPDGEGESPEDKERLLMRLKKGLRLGTIKIRALTAERIQRWCITELGQNWVENASQLEDLMKDLAKGSTAGESTFDRLRYSVIYLEAAAGIKAPDQIGNDPSMKGTVKELAYKASCEKDEEKKQAPQHLVHILKEWEEAICSEDTPEYLRGYLWLKLVTFWGVIRGEDSTYIEASSIKKSARGIRGRMTQTKTTGPGKKVRIRTFEVSSEAYFLDQEWLEIGFNVWEQEDKNRDNFILLPGPAFETFRDLGAEIQDRMALTRKCIKDFGVPDSDEGGWSSKVIEVVSRFWTEHSSRSSLVSMARALGVPKEVTDRLGWWAVGTQASEDYIRTYSTLSAKVQALVAGTCRSALQAKEAGRCMQDVFGEERVLEKLSETMEEQGINLNDEGIPELISLFRTFGTDTTNMEELPKWNTTDLLVPQLINGRDASHDPVFRDSPKRNPAGDEKPLDLLVPQLINGRATSHDPMIPNAEGMEGEPRFEKDGDKEEEVEVPEIGTWVISDAAYRGTKCLHIVGGCHRVPGVHYKLWTPVADPVCESSFKKVCKVCFPEGYPWEGILADDEIEREVELGMLATQAGEEDTASETESC